MMKINKRKIITCSYIFGILSIVLLAIASILPKLTFSDNTYIYTVDSGSMAPAIKKGSLIRITKDDEYFVNDVITVSITNDPTRTYTHRVVEVINDQGIISYRTKGDANDSVDTNPVQPENVLGKVTIHLPYLGYFIMISKTPIGFILMVILPALAIITSELVNIKKEINTLKNTKSKTTRKRKGAGVNTSLILVVPIIACYSFSTYSLTKSGYVDAVHSHNNGFATESPVLPSRELGFQEEQPAFLGETNYIILNENPVDSVILPSDDEIVLEESGLEETTENLLIEDVIIPPVNQDITEVCYLEQPIILYNSPNSSESESRS